MKQLSLPEASWGSNGSKPTRKAVFLAEMEAVVPWARLEALIEPVYPKKGNGRPPMPLRTMLRIHFLQQWFGYSDPAMEEALSDIPLLRRFARLDAFDDALPDESTILRFRHLLEQHRLAEAIFAEVQAVLAEQGVTLKRGTVVDATLIAAPSSTKNRAQQRDPEMTQTKKGNQWYFGMKAHIGVDTKSGVVHTVACTTAKVSDITMLESCLHGAETLVLGDRGYHKKTRTRDHLELEGARAVLVPTKKPAGGELTSEQKAFNRQLSSARALVEHPFRVLKRQFGYVKVRYRGLAKNTGQLVTLFALGNLWLVRKRLLPQRGAVCP